jgi:nitrite reductase (NADH) small subunit
MSAPALFTDTQLMAPQLQPTREVCLGSLQNIPMGEGRAYRVGKEVVAVFRQRNGRVYAIQNECPHRGGPLAEGIMGAGTVICPFHAWKVDIETGECLSDPCTLRTYSVRVDDDTLYLKVGE